MDLYLNRIKKKKNSSYYFHYHFFLILLDTTFFIFFPKLSLSLFTLYPFFILAWMCVLNTVHDLETFVT